jgi:hypothetical protein
MNKVIRALIILAAFLLICPHLGQADILYIKNGDKFFGTIQNPSFTVQTPYGRVSIKNKFLKSLNYKEGSIGRWTIETINNDRFSGTLLNDSIQFIQEDGKQKKLSKEQIQRIKREISGPSYSITTTIFTMKNNDRFSGKFLNGGLEIRANHTTKSIQPGEINRIEFTEDYQAGTAILLENGDLITGTLKQNQIRLAPDAVPELTLTKSSLKSIQFNAPKMVLKKSAKPVGRKKTATVMESLILRIYARIHPMELQLARTAVERRQLLQKLLKKQIEAAQQIITMQFKNTWLVILKIFCSILIDLSSSLSIIQF